MTMGPFCNFWKFYSYCSKHSPNNLVPIWLSTKMPLSNPSQCCYVGTKLNVKDDGLTERVICHHFCTFWGQKNNFQSFKDETVNAWYFQGRKWIFTLNFTLLWVFSCLVFSSWNSLKVVGLFCCWSLLAKLDTNSVTRTMPLTIAMSSWQRQWKASLTH